MSLYAYRGRGPDGRRRTGVTEADSPKAARAALAEIGVTDIPTVGLAERMEILVTDDARGDIFLPRDSQGLFVATRLRDEAHRFAITHHRHLRDRSIRESALDEVPGIGPAKKVALLKRFKSIYGIARASAEEVAAAAGVGRTTAEEVLKAARSAASERT